MPTVLRVKGFRFFFYAYDCAEPIHLHVTRGKCLAKVWVESGVVARSVGFRQHELRRIQRIIEENREYIIARWHQFCGG